MNIQQVCEQMTKGVIHKWKEEIGQLGNQLAATQRKYQQLHQAYSHNLQIIEQRTEQIDKLEQQLEQKLRKQTQMKQQVQSLSARVNELQTSNHAKAKKLSNRIEQLSEQNQHLKEQLKEIELQNEKIKSTEIQKKERLQRQINQVASFAAAKVKAEQQHYQSIINNIKESHKKLISQQNNQIQSLQSQLNKLQLQSHFEKQELRNLRQEKTKDQISLKARIDQLETVNRLLTERYEDLKTESRNKDKQKENKFSAIENQKEKMKESLDLLSIKNKEKLRMLKEQFCNKVNDIVQENKKANKKYEQTIRTLQLQNQRLLLAERNWKSKQLQFQTQLKRIRNDDEQKYNFLLKTIEEEKKFLKHQLELRDIRNQRLQENCNQANLSSQKFKNQLKLLQHKLQQIRKQNQLLVQQLCKFKQVNVSKAKTIEKKTTLKKQEKNKEKYEVIFSGDMGPAESIEEIKSQITYGIGKSYNEKKFELFQKEVEQLRNQKEQLERHVKNMVMEIQNAGKINQITKKEIKLGKQEKQFLNKQLQQKQLNHRQKILEMKNQINIAHQQNQKLKHRYLLLQQKLIQYKEFQEKNNQLHYFIENLKQKINSLQQQIQQLEQISSQLRARLRLYQQTQYKSNIVSQNAKSSGFGQLLQQEEFQSQHPQKDQTQKHYQKNRGQKIARLINQKRHIQKKFGQINQMKGIEIKLEERYFKKIKQTQGQKKAFQNLKKKSKQKQKQKQKQKKNRLNYLEIRKQDYQQQQ